MADDNTLWVGGLADEVTEDHLYELFLQAGPLHKVTRPKEKDGSLKKFAFVEFSHAESVPYAMQVMDGIKLFNHHLRLKGRTGSSHDGGHSNSPSSQMFSNMDLRGHNGSRGAPDYNRSRSYQGSGHQKPALNRLSSSEDRRGFHRGSFNSSDALTQSFSNTAAYNMPNMQPQSSEDRRNRLLHKQSMSLGAHAQMQGGHNQRGGHNYAQSFSSYGHQSGQQQQQWYLNNY